MNNYPDKTTEMVNANVAQKKFPAVFYFVFNN